MARDAREIQEELAAAELAKWNPNPFELAKAVAESACGRIAELEKRVEEVERERDEAWSELAEVYDEIVQLRECLFGELGEGAEEFEQRSGRRFTKQHQGCKEVRDAT